MIHRSARTTLEGRDAFSGARYGHIEHRLRTDTTPVRGKLVSRSLAFQDAFQQSNSDSLFPDRDVKGNHRIEL